MAHGQPSAPEPAEIALAGLAEKVQLLLPEMQVGSATMAASGVLEAALQDMVDGSLIFPLFMADGWFVKTALAKRLNGRALHVLKPLGLDPQLPALAAKAVVQAAEAAGWHAPDTHLFLAAHGSAQGDASARSARRFVERLDLILPSAGKTVGFIEEAPFLAAAAASLGAPALCLPFFAMPGEHVRDDVPDALAEAGFTGPVLPAFSQYDGIARLIADTLRAGLSERQAA